MFLPLGISVSVYSLGIIMTFDFQFSNLLNAIKVLFPSLWTSRQRLKYFGFIAFFIKEN